MITVPPGNVFWDLPVDCSNTEVGGRGFDNSVCILPSPNLAHGWMYTKVRVDPLFSSTDRLFLTGKAEYYKSGDLKKDGICVDDNFYFYVNGQLIARGGTTGNRGNLDNVLDIGEEVLKDCGGCSDLTPNPWCIPPVEITSAGAFRYNGENNEVAVLLEDYCKGLTEHSGGLTPFSITFV